jgi:hypothetical protein
MFEACDRHEIRLECERCVEGSQLKECREARQCVGDSKARKLEDRVKGDRVCILRSVGQVYL